MRFQMKIPCFFFTQNFETGESLCFIPDLLIDRKRLNSWGGGQDYGKG